MAGAMAPDPLDSSLAGSSGVARVRGARGKSLVLRPLGNLDSSALRLRVTPLFRIKTLTSKKSAKIDFGAPTTVIFAPFNH